MKVEDLKIWDTLEVVTAMPGIPGGMIGVVAGVSHVTKVVTCVATFEIPFECIEHDKVRHVPKNPAFLGADLLMHDQAQQISAHADNADSSQMHLPALHDAVPVLSKSVQRRLEAQMPVWKETLEGNLVEEESRPSWQGSVLPKGEDGK